MIRTNQPEFGDSEVLLVNLGKHSFAIPLGHVRSISPIPHDFIDNGADSEDYFVFEGNPLPYVSLWDELSSVSLYAEYAQLLRMLPQRQQDHLDRKPRSAQARLSAKHAIRVNAPSASGITAIGHRIAGWPCCWASSNIPTRKFMGWDTDQVEMSADTVVTPLSA